MPRRSETRLVMAIAFALALLEAICVGAHAESAPPSSDPPRVHLTRCDAWYGLATVAGVGITALADDWFRERASGGDGADRLARSVRPFGAPQVLGPALLLGYLGGRALDQPRLSAASKRVATSVVIAGVAAEALKLAVGRVRPADWAQEPDHFQPFSEHDSFPSGHATLSFATATALDRETSARWLPWVVYPLAGLVGWSRVHDDRHWTSDVVAGAALGYWTARKTEDVLRVRAKRPGRLGILPGTNGRSLRLGAGLSF